MTRKAIFRQYFADLATVARQGDAREESFYPALAAMFTTVANETGRKHAHVTTLPRPTDAGNPDFRVWNGTDRIIGYIEAKNATEERLDGIEESEQLTRYRATFPNLILTNFLEFRLYRNGERVDTVRAARPLILQRLRAAPPIEKPDELYSVLDRFLGFSLPKAFTAESLALELAKRTRFFRDIIAQQFEEEKGAPAVLSGFFKAFQTYLMGTLTPQDFANLFAQTITYGLFVARIRAGGTFNRRAAFENIPHTIGVLHDLFRFISLGELPEQLAWCVDDIAEVLAVADAPGILARYYREGKGSDPIVHFYETFLAQYDPGERERRGVYYTPEPVVGYIVRSLHGLLRTAFGKPDGLASDGVTLLDPAAGTMTFVALAAQQSVAEFEVKYGSGGREDFIRRHILRNFYAFELMMAPYAVGHLKMGFFLEELGHRLSEEERVRFYLTNTLDMKELEHSYIPGLSSLAEESRLAGTVKKDTPILVILGNPPYSGHSVNKGEWILGKIKDYKQVDGKPLGEKNPKWLQDDYVKFIRFAQWKIDQADHGIVGMITNHSYLDNPTFRGMRQSLMKTFDEIYVLDLHGNALKKETCPDGSPDQNVFDIRQGVAIAFFVKHGGTKEADAVVCHADIFGKREVKYRWLNDHEQAATSWSKIEPRSPSYLFVPQDHALEDTYQRFPAVDAIFLVNSVGIVTARDSLTIHRTSEEMWKTVTVFSNMETELARQGYKLGKDVRDWQVDLAQKDLRDSGPTRKNVAPMLYRPFDVRHTYYTGRSRGFICRPRPEVMRHMLPGDNVALLVPKRVEYVGPWQHAFVTNALSDHVAVSLKTIDYHFPLHLYPAVDRTDLFAHHEPAERVPNLEQGLVIALRKAYGKEPSPEDVFHYVYAVLFAPTYRKKYADLLRRGFPRIPFTADPTLFTKVAKRGESLVKLHLLCSPHLDRPSCRFEGKGDGKTGKGRKGGPRYDPKAQRVYINTTQYFAPVRETVWSCQIGGYQVCEKWLKDRQERRLQLDDIRTYCRIVTALARTIEIQAEIDAVYDDVEKSIVSIPAPVRKPKSGRPKKPSTGRRGRTRRGGGRRSRKS